MALEKVMGITCRVGSKRHARLTADRKHYGDLAVYETNPGANPMTTDTPPAALTYALFLAITAPDQARADRAIALAESIGAGCTAKQIATAKRNASKLAAD